MIAEELINDDAERRILELQAKLNRVAVENIRLAGEKRLATSDNESLRILADELRKQRDEAHTESTRLLTIIDRAKKQTEFGLGRVLKVLDEAIVPAMVDKEA